MSREVAKEISNLTYDETDVKDYQLIGRAVTEKENTSSGNTSDRSSSPEDALMVEDREEDAHYFVRELWARLEDNEVRYLMYAAEYIIEDEQHSSNVEYCLEGDRAETIYQVAEWAREGQDDFERDTAAFDWKDWSSVGEDGETVQFPPEKMVREWLGGTSTDEEGGELEDQEPDGGDQEDVEDVFDEHDDADEVVDEYEYEDDDEVVEEEFEEDEEEEG